MKDIWIGFVKLSSIVFVLPLYILGYAIYGIYVYWWNLNNSIVGEWSFKIEIDKTPDTGKGE